MFTSLIERSVWISTLVAALGTGVMSGVFFAFSSFVMKALAVLPVPQGITAMQAINTAAINPVFLAVFLGNVLLCTPLAIYCLASWHQRGTTWILLGSLLYLVAGVLTTVVFNVPLNSALAQVDPVSEDSAMMWSHYLATWSAWNHVRAVGSLFAAAALIVGLSRWQQAVR
jgi:uncharacterized membrane protein